MRHATWRSRHVSRSNRKVVTVCSAARGGVEGIVLLTSAQTEVGGELHVPAALLPAKRK